MIFPPDEARDGVAISHPRALEDPVVVLPAHPVAAAVHGLDVARADEEALVRPALGEGAVIFFAVHGELVVAAIRAAAEHDALGPPVESRAHRRDPADGVAGEKEDVHARVAHRDDAAKCADVPVFIVADAEERPALQAAFGRVHVAVRAIGDVVAVLFEPVGHGEFKAQPLARADGLRVLVDLRVLRIRPVEAHVRPRPLVAARIRVHGEIVRPAVVGLPRVVAALHEDVRLAVVLDDEDDVALPVGGVVAPGNRGQAAEINAAHPVGRNLDGNARLPAAFAQAVLADGRDFLLRAVEWPERLHEARAAAAVVAGAEDLDAKFRRGLRAHEDVELLPGLHGLPRAVAFDEWRAVAADLVEPNAGELPVGRAGLRVLRGDDAGIFRCGALWCRSE